MVNIRIGIGIQDGDSIGWVLRLDISVKARREAQFPSGPVGRSGALLGLQPFDLHFWSESVIGASPTCSVFTPSYRSSVNPRLPRNQGEQAAGGREVLILVCLSRIHFCSLHASRITTIVNISSLFKRRAVPTACCVPPSPQTQTVCRTNAANWPAVAGRPRLEPRPVSPTRTRGRGVYHDPGCFYETGVYGAVPSFFRARLYYHTGHGQCTYSTVAKLPRPSPAARRLRLVPPPATGWKKARAVGTGWRKARAVFR